MATTTPVVATKFSMTTDIATLNTADIVKLTTDEIAALTAKQLTELNATQIGTLSDKQLFVLPLKSVPAEILSAISLKSIPSLNVSKLSGEQFNALDVSQIATLSSTQVATLTKTQLGNANADSLVALSVGTVKAPGGLAGLKLSLLTSDQLSALSVEEIATLSTNQIGQINAKLFAAITSDQAGAFTTQQASAFKSLAGLNEEAFNALSTSVISALSTKTFSQLSALQLKALSVDQSAALTSTEIGALKSGQVASLETDDISVLSIQALLGFNKNNITGLALEGLTGEGQFSALSTKQISSFSAVQMNKISGEQANLITSATIKALSANQIKALSTLAISSLEPNSFNGLTAKNIAGLSASAIEAINTDQAAKLSANVVKFFNVDQIGAMSAENILNLPNKTFKAIPAKLISAISSTVFATLPSEEVAILSPEQIGALTTKQLSQFDAEQASGLSAAQISKFSAQQISGIKADGINALPIKTFQAISSSAVTGIAPTVFSSLSTEIIKGLSPSQIGALSSEQVAKFGAEQIGGLSIQQMNALTPQKIAKFSKEVIAGLDVKVLNIISNRLANLVIVGGNYTGSVANVASILDTLETKVEAGTLTAITLSDASANSLVITASQLIKDQAALKKISGEFVINLAPGETLTARQMSVVPIAVAKHIKANSVTIKDSAAEVQNVWDVLHTLNLDPPIGHIIFTDQIIPTLVLKSEQLNEEIAVISEPEHGLFKFIESAYNLVITNAFAMGIDALTRNSLIDGVQVVDTAANISAHWLELEAAIKTGKLKGVTVSDGGTVDVQDLFFYDSMALVVNQNPSKLNTASADLMKLITGASSFNIISNNYDYFGDFDCYQKNSVGQILYSGAIHVAEIAPLNISVPIHLVATNVKYVDPILSVPDMLGIQEAVNNHVIADFRISNSFTFDSYRINEINLITNFNVLDNEASIRWYVFGNRLTSFPQNLTISQFVSFYNSAFFTEFKKHFNYYDCNSYYSDNFNIDNISGSSKELSTNLDDVIAFLLNTVRVYGDYEITPFNHLILTDTFLPVLPVSVTQINNAKQAFMSHIVIDNAQNGQSLFHPQKYLLFDAITIAFVLSIQGSAAQFNQLDLTGVTRNSIEIKPSDLTSNMTITGSNVVDLNLSALNVPNATVTKQALISNGIASTQVNIQEANGGALHTITLVGTDASKLVIYAPLDTLVTPVGIWISGNLTSVLASNALVSAANANVTSISVYDTAENIQTHFDDLLKVYKAGKLAAISSNESLNLTISADNIALGNGGILDVITTLHNTITATVTAAYAATATVATGNDSVILTYVEDTAANITANWDKLETAVLTGRLKGITVSDGGIITVADLFLDPANRITYTQTGSSRIPTYTDSSTWFTALNEPSANLMKLMTGMTGFNIIDSFYDPGFDNIIDSSYIHSNNFINRAIPTSIYPALKTLKANLKEIAPFHLLDNSDQKKDDFVILNPPSTISYLSTHDLLALQSAIADNTISDFTLEGSDQTYGTIPFKWYLSDFNEIGLITNSNTFKMGTTGRNIFASPLWAGMSVTSTLTVSQLVDAVTNSAVYQSMQCSSASEQFSPPPLIDVINGTTTEIGMNLHKITAFVTKFSSYFIASKSAIHLTDKFPSVLLVSTTQLTQDGVILAASIDQKFLLSVRDSSVSLSNLDLTSVANCSIELQPIDLTSNITISGAVVRDVDLSKLSYLGASVTKKSVDVNGSNSTEIDVVEAGGGAKHVITLVGTDLASVTVFAPLNSLVAPTSGISGVRSSATVANALADAANSNVTTVSVSDTASNITAHFEDLIKIYKAGKLAGISTSDSSALSISLSFQDIVLGYGNILDLITTPYTVSATISADLADIQVSNVTVTDTAENISANWSKLESAFLSGKLTGITVSDGGVVSILDLFIAQGNTIDNFDGPQFSHLNATSASVLKLITGASSFNIFPQFTQPTLADDVSKVAIPPQIYPELASLSLAVPLHLVVPSASASNTDFFISTHDLLALQDAVSQNIVSQLTLTSLNHLNWYLNDFNDGGLIANNTLIATHLSIRTPETTTTTPLSATFNANQISKMYQSPVYSIYDRICNPDINPDNKFYVKDSATQISTYLDKIGSFIDYGRERELPILFTDNFSPVLSVTPILSSGDYYSYIGESMNAIKSITGSYLLSITGNSSVLHNLDLFPTTDFKNQSIELKPRDLSDNITVSGGSVKDVNLAELSYVGAVITTKSVIIDDAVSTEIDLTEINGSVHTIRLIGTPLNSVTVYAPLDTIITPAANVSGIRTAVSANNALAEAANPNVTLVIVNDTASNIIAKFGELVEIYKAGKLGIVTINDSTSFSMPITNEQLLQYGGVLNQLTTLSSVTNFVSGYASISIHPTVNDTASVVQANLDNLQDRNDKLFGITLTDSGIPTLTLTDNQYSKDLAILNKISSVHNLNIISGRSDVIQDVMGNIVPFDKGYLTHISSVQSTVGGLLTFKGIPNSLDLSDTTPTTINYDATMANEVIEIVNFQSELDSIHFNNLGSNTLQILNTRAEGQIATYIHSSEDSSHGVVIIGVNSANLSVSNGVVSHV